MGRSAVQGRPPHSPPPFHTYACTHGDRCLRLHQPHNVLPNGRSKGDVMSPSAEDRQSPPLREWESFVGRVSMSLHIKEGCS